MRRAGGWNKFRCARHSHRHTHAAKMPAAHLSLLARISRHAGVAEAAHRRRAGDDDDFAAFRRSNASLSRRREEAAEAAAGGG